MWPRQQLVLAVCVCVSVCVNSAGCWSDSGGERGDRHTHCFVCCVSDSAHILTM